MSRRNYLAVKRERRARKSTRKKNIAYLDLIEFVKTRAHCSTGKAIAIIMAGALRVDSHVIGIQRDAMGKKMLNRHVPADYRGRIVVAPLEDLDVG